MGGDGGAIGVMLLNMGGPDSLEAVEPFLYNLFSDREIIRLGPGFMQRPLARFISRRRAPKAAGYYRLIGGKSPLRELTEAQARALETRMREHGDFRVYVGMRYWRPFVADTLGEAMGAGLRRLISLTLYPQYSIATTGSTERSLREAIEGAGDRAPECSYISSWFAHPRYIDALAEVIREGLSGFEDAHILFSAHSLPRKFIDEGDPYEREVMGTILAVMGRFEGRAWSLGYQSKTGPVKWLEPATGDVIKGLAAKGVKRALAVPVSFVSDHVETLYEIDILYRELALGLGVELRRVAPLNTRPLFIGALEELALGRAKELGWI